MSGPDRFRVRVWSKTAVVSVRGRIDSHDCGELKQTVGNDHWSGPLPGDRLSKGEHRFDVEVLGEDGCPGVQTIHFTVDPTGRYTAVPAVQPVVTQTAFC